jgi:hypothetical protein
VTAAQEMTDLCQATTGRPATNCQTYRMRTACIISLAVSLIVMAGNASPVQQAKPKPQARSIQPFTYGNVVAHLKAAGLRATEVQKRCTIFFEGEWTNANIYNYCVIMVENSDEDVQVTFYLTDAHEMNWGNRIPRRTVLRSI